MTIKEKYQKLVAQGVDLSLKDQIYALRDTCLLEQNHEYYYLCNLLMADLLIDALLFDDAMQIINKDMTHFDRVTFQNIYVQYLERLIFIHIKKRNFKVAHRYVFEKRKYIDEKKRDQVNRWYLEMSYIYAEMNQLSKALAMLKAILENLPDEELLSYTLSNLTKLYIDEHMLEDAKDALNQALLITHDEEGKAYCNYLFAKICVLEKKYDKALLLYDEIFKEAVDFDYVSIANDYLDLLITMKKHKEAEAFIHRMEPTLQKLEDTDIKKEFLKNKLKLILSKIGIIEAEQLLKQIEIQEKHIIAQEAHILNENAEINQENEVSMHIQEALNRIERLVGMMQIALNNPSLRDLLMDFSRKLENFISLNNVTYVMFDEYDVTLNQELMVYQYKKQRLYEKIILPQQINQTIVDMMLRHSQEIILDLSHSNLSLKDCFSGKYYQELSIKHIFGIPSFANNRLFLATIFSADETDITTLENTILIKIATKLLEKSVAHYFLEHQLKWAEFRSKAVVDYAQVYTMIRTPDSVILDQRLAKYLALKKTFFSKQDFENMIVKNDVDAYQNFIQENQEGIELDYRIKSSIKTIKLRETIYPYEGNDKDLRLSIIRFEKDQEAILLHDQEFDNLISEYKKRINDLEFKFSLVRIKGEISDYNHIKEVFDTNPYFLSDNSFIIILENEVHQRTLDKYVHHLKLPYAIVRFPRDLVQIDDVVKFSKICLDNDITYFTEEAYKKYLKKVSINDLVKRTLHEPFELWYLRLEKQNQDVYYEAKLRIKGIAEKENVRSYLDDEVLLPYELQLFETLQESNIQDRVVILLSTMTCSRLLDDGKLHSNKKLTIMIDRFTKDLSRVLGHLAENQIDVFVDYSILDNLRAIDLTLGVVKGIAILEGIEKIKRDFLLKFAKQHNLEIFSNYMYPDYSNNLYRTEILTKDNDDGR